MTQQQVRQYRAQHQQDADISDQIIRPMGRRKISFPFRYLRTWLFSLFALVALPIGAGMFLVGLQMQEDLDGDWRETTAEVIEFEENVGVSYELDETFSKNEEEGYIGFEFEDFVTTDDGTIMITADLCDVASRFIIPTEAGETFTMWYNDDNPSEHSCVDISEDSGSFFLLAGLGLVLFSVWRLIRTFHSAGTKPV